MLAANTMTTISAITTPIVIRSGAGSTNNAAWMKFMGPATPSLERFRMLTGKADRLSNRTRVKLYEVAGGDLASRRLLNKGFLGAGRLARPSAFV